MDLSTRVLGSTTAKHLHDRNAAPILRIGRDSFTRGDLSRVECFNFVAAQNLSAILNRELKVKDAKDVFEHVHPMQLALPRLGAIALAVLGAAFEAKGVGGQAPLEAWVTNHLEKDQSMVTFASLKHRDAAERAKERTTLKRRKAARRTTAHGLRVARFEARAASA